MVKFKYAIHKETQILFTYGDWLKYKEFNAELWFSVENVKFKYNPIDIILSNDFEIIYDNGFTTEELKEMMWNMDTSANDNKYKIIDKLAKEIKTRYNIEQRFGIEWE
ncbi:hypothetical protein [Clostridium botulinum]|uniref:hypothetical protein n=1 Tax=Clostridium botulinum TaxID=1491 RepID=UPI001C9AC893|nr:hypothetical protein [Clostridium botulinum]MBY6838664.1 hypothetical protein [Clostridium botulinum]